MPTLRPWSAKTNLSDTVNRTYAVGDSVLYGTLDQAYTCTTQHLASDTFVPDFLSGFWEKQVEVYIRYIKSWSPKDNTTDLENSLYDAGEQRSYSNLVYTCTQSHVSEGSFVLDP
jgi:hypothetical protein